MVGAPTAEVHTRDRQQGCSDGVEAAGIGHSYNAAATMRPAAILVLGVLLACGDTAREEADPTRFSRLWGEDGEAWNPASRLPDFSWAGYRGGLKPPAVPVAADVRDFGARGDGTSDDTRAFLEALASVERGAVYIPPGRYRITDVLPLDRPGLVLRGAGPAATTLFFPGPLADVGRGEYGGPSGWAWGGGWITAHGTLGEGPTVATVVAPARRGDRILQVSATAGLEPGRFVRLVQRESDGSLSLSLHNGQRLDGRCWVDRPGLPVIDWVVQIAAVGAGRVELARPLRADVRPEWQPELLAYTPAVSEVGVEHLSIDFPVVDYPGHHLEPGLNAIFFREVHDAWVRDVEISNFDNGVTLWLTRHVTVFGVVLTGRPGHYGFNLLASQDSLVTDFDIRNASLHDLSVSNLANGNVFSRGRGVRINFDHHRGAPYENLFSNINVGTSWKERRLWQSSATASGHYAAARETFWNIRPGVSTRYLPAWPQLNVIGRLGNGAAAGTPPLDDVYLEAIDRLEPRDLHRAQVAARRGRLRGRGR